MTSNGKKLSKILLKNISRNKRVSSCAATYKITFFLYRYISLINGGPCVILHKYIMCLKLIRKTRLRQKFSALHRECSKILNFCSSIIQSSG